jgi:hypothetical protein
VVDDQLQPRVLLRDLRDLGQEGGGEQRDGEPGALGGRPQPVDRPIGRPRLLVRLQEGETEPPHPGPALPAVDQRAALRPIERKVAQDRQPVRMLARCLDGQLVRARIPRGRGVDHGRVHAGRVHLLEELVLGEGGHLAMVGVGRLATAPDVDLRIDDQHDVPLRRPAPRWARRP